MNAIYNIGPGDMESIMQCGHKLDVEKDTIKRALRAMWSLVSDKPQREKGVDMIDIISLHHSM
jgi:hypothetical protein